MAKHEYLDVTHLVVHDKLEVGHLRLTDTSWDDLRFPASGVNLDSAATRYSFDKTNLGILFADNSRYTDEQVSMIGQYPHHAKAERNIHPHIHWEQDSSTIPNFLLAWRITNNGAAPGAWTLSTINNHKFTYVSGSIIQISEFDEINMTGTTISCLLEFKLWNDTANTSTEFAGAQAKAVLFKEFDVHYEIDSLGSNDEYVKGD